MFWDEKVADLNAKILTIFFNKFYLCQCQKVLIRKEKKIKEDEQHFVRIKFSSALFASEMSANALQLEINHR